MTGAQEASAQSTQTGTLPISLDKLIGFEISLERTEGRKKALNDEELRFLISPYLTGLDKSGVPYFFYSTQDSDESIRLFVLGDPTKLTNDFKIFASTLQEGIKAELLDQSGISTFEKYVASIKSVAEKIVADSDKLKIQYAELSERLIRTEQELVKSSIVAGQYREMSRTVERKEGEVRLATNNLEREREKTASLQKTLVGQEQRISQISRYESQLRGLETRVRELSDERTQLRQTNERLKEENKGLYQQIEGLTVKPDQSNPSENQAAVETGLEPRIEIIPSIPPQPEQNQSPEVFMPSQCLGVWLYQSIESSKYENVRNFLLANANKIKVGEIYSVAINGFVDKAHIDKFSKVLCKAGVTDASPENMVQIAKHITHPILPLNTDESDIDWEGLIKYRVARLGFASFGEFARETKTYSSEAPLYVLLKKPCRRDISYKRLSEAIFVNIMELRAISPKII